MNHSKKIFNFLLFISVFSFCFSQFASASSMPTLTKGPHTKLARGLTDIVTSPWQLPKEIIQKTADLGDRGPAAVAPIGGFFWGSATGVYRIVRQFALGTTDVITFMAPVHNKTWEPLGPQASKFPEI